jgi:hypothetical protein
MKGKQSILNINNNNKCISNVDMINNDTIVHSFLRKICPANTIEVPIARFFC